MDSATKDHYWKKGWAVVNGVFDDKAIDTVLERAMTVSQALMEEDPDSLYKVDAAEDGIKWVKKLLMSPAGTS